MFHVAAQPYQEMWKFTAKLMISMITRLPI